ncbi:MULTISPECIES: DNA glycosylase AlkZ-like family protein [unclassified Streptomyces]|uniref:DNA glycosylase AlkZ-like family protein n=1 Tax=unclassified Streptomyces TaxID=2593676 RepID=UPI0037ABB20C
MNGTARIEVSREQVLRYRVAAQGFDRASPAPEVLALGVQDTPNGSARVALAARGASGDPLERVWSFRGAPHLHRRADLAALAEALWPLDDADATARIDTAVIKGGAHLGLAAFRVTAEAFRGTVTAPLGKGEVSTAVSAAVPESLTYWCVPCEARHISGLLFQQAGLFGSVRVGIDRGKTVLAPLASRFPVPATASGTEGLVRAYLRFLGPATRAEVAAFLGTRPTAIRPVWPDGLAEVAVDGRTAWLPESEVEALRGAPRARAVRLLPPGDPFLQARDRSLLLPARTRQKELWRSVGGPGAVLAGSEIVGTWRGRAAGRRAEVSVTGFTALSAAVRKGLEAEAQTVAVARGADEAVLRIG